MSLHTLAHHLQSAGRGEDKVLVHMTPGEVNGLQSLAMAHGGSLSINPETGLPEAGFLKSLLPMLAGGALTFFSGGALSPLAASMIVGGGTAAATGSLKKGLMAGLGAYGGAGMGAGLSSMATPAAAPAVSGLSPSVAANTSALGGTSQFAKAGAENILTSADDLLMQGAKNVPVGGYDPSMSSVFVKNAPVPAVTPANAADFMNQTNQSILGKLPNAGNLPVAGTKPVPFSDIPASADSLTMPGKPLYEPVPQVRITQPQGKLVGEFPSPYHDAYTGGVKTIAPFNPPPGTAGVSTDSLTGYKYYGPGGDEIGGAFPVKGGSVPIESRTSYVPIERRTPTLLEKSPVRSEILPGDAPLAQPQSITGPFRDRMAELGRGAKASFGSLEGLKGLYSATEAAAPYATYAGLGSTAYSMYDEKRQQMEDEMRARAAANQGLIRPYTFDYGVGSGDNVSAQPYFGSAERTYFQPTYTAGTPYKAPGPEYAAAGGLMGLAVGGPVEDMASMNAVGANTGYPMAALQTPMYANPAMQRPEATNVIAPSADAGVTSYSGEPRFAKGGTAEPQSTGYAYDYNPSTMQFTQTGGPGVSKVPTGQELAQGLGAMDMQKRFNEMAITGKPYNFTPSWASGTTPSGTVGSGIATPMMQPAAPAQSFIPNISIPAYQTPEQQLGLGGFYDYMNQQMGGYGGYAAGGGVSTLGDYSDGGRLLKGPGDGVSDSIPASIGNRQPARLADGEFVVPARIVSEIGNGSTEAGARKLYAMMDRVQKARRKTTGKNQVAANTKAEKLLPA